MDRGLRLVVIEGQVAQRHALLEPDGFEIAAFARPGPESLSVVGRHRPHAVLFDLDPSESTSTTAVRRLVERFPDIPAIFLGGSVSPDDIAAVFEAGASAYIVKATQLDHLGDAVRRAIGMGSAGAALGSSADPVLIPGRNERRLADRRATTDRRTLIAAAVVIERRTGVDRRMRARRRDDLKLEPAL